MSCMAPIIVFAYNRPDHLHQTLAHLADAEGASQSDLWIFCDGSKDGADFARIEATRSVAGDSAWISCFRSVRIETSQDNKGLAQSIIGGVSAVLEGAGRVIVVEDDVLVAPDFLRFMNDCLKFYESDQKVGSVTGFSPFAEQPPDHAKDVMAIPRNCSQCWGTWADRWYEIDWDARDAGLLWSKSSLRRRFNTAGNDRVDRLRRQLEGKIDSWSIRFGLWQTLSGRHTIYPLHNRVRNIGYDGSGVHTRHGQNVNRCTVLQPRSYTLEHVVEQPSIVRRVARIYGGPWYKRFLRDLRTWLGMRGFR
ncbi:glycosyltransferase family A protein [Marinobacter sp. RI1]|uniref:glycosyltransferase family A protein n=1 Tax=Marinobacter sp. RI1 TaxID=3158171 RepID=UPI0034E8841E